MNLNNKSGLCHIYLEASKKLVRLVLMFSVAFTLFSCGEEDADPVLAVSSQLFHFNALDGEKYAVITTDKPDYDVTVEAGNTWVTTEKVNISPLTLRIKVTASDVEAVREARIVVRADGAPDVALRVVQAAYIPPKRPIIVGNWQFPASNILAANIGADLEKTGDGFTEKAGPNGRNAVTVAKGSYLLAKHGIKASGGTKVNEFTILWDVHMDWVESWYSLFNASVTNSNDGDLWIGKDNREIGVGVLGYLSNVFPNDNAWYRIVLSAKLGESIKIYVDGVPLNKMWNKLKLDDDKYALDPAGVLLFACSAGDDGDIDVTEVTIWDQVLTDDEVAKIGKVGTSYLP
ncbi:MAG: hypothetical protein LBT83_05570 [Tannerella sp.]|nr:hypothetical protein [Tannerella sp.]